MLDQNWVMDQLRSNVCEIVFNKVDGTERKMRCTLNSEYLPELYRGHGQLLTEVERNTISVWDLDAMGWRSFRVENLVSLHSVGSQRQQFLLG